MKKITLFFPFLLCVTLSYSQMPPEKHTKKGYVDQDGKYYVQAELPVYLFASTTPEVADAQILKSEKQSEFSNPMYLDGHGVHQIRHLDYEKEIPEREVSFQIYADGIAPKTKLVLQNSPAYQAEETTFYGKGLTLNLPSSDEMSGVAGTYLSINKSPYREHNQVEKLSKEGEYVVTAYAVDQVGNVEQAVSKAFVIDITAPKTAVSYQGPEVMVGETWVLSPKGSYVFTKEDQRSGVKETTYYYDKGTPKTLQGSTIAMGALSEGTHSLAFQSVDRVENQESEQFKSFFMDKSAPTLTISITGDQYSNEKTNFVSERSKIHIDAIDNKAGVASIHYAFGDDMVFQLYENDFAIPKHVTHLRLKYYGVDKVENKGKLQSSQKVYYADRMAPSIHHKYVGKRFFTRDTTFIREITKISLHGTDAASGLKGISYTLDQDSPKTYQSPFVVDKGGLHYAHYVGSDLVNNQTAKDFFFVVDNEAPEIHHHFGSKSIGFKEIRGENILIYSRHSKLYLAATDKAVGTDKIYYTMGKGKDQLYVDPIKDFVAGRNYHVTIRAVDYLGNVSKTKIVFSVED